MEIQVHTPNINQLANDGLVIIIAIPLRQFARLVVAVLLQECINNTWNTTHAGYKKSSVENQINKHTSLPYYSPKPIKPIRFFTEDLRANGYYCTNNSKEDYNMLTSPLAGTKALMHIGETGKMVSLFFCL